MEEKKSNSQFSNKGPGNSLLKALAVTFDFGLGGESD